jgi:hypothetical protein
MKCHDMLRDEGLADDEQSTVTREAEPRDPERLVWVST